MTDFKTRPKLKDIIVDDLVNNGIGRFVYKNFVKTIDFKGDESVLEFGCGTGSLSRHILKKIPNGKLFGIDISKYQVERAEKRLRKHKNVSLTTGDICDKIYGGESFDIAAIHYVLHHVEKENRQQTIDEIYRLLKKDSFLYIREPGRLGDGMPKEEIMELAKNAGFKKIRDSVKKNVYTACFEK